MNKGNLTTEKKGKGKGQGAKSAALQTHNLSRRRDNRGVVKAAKIITTRDLGKQR
ncbi:MAG: hypothetical protein WBC70_01310 [Candidatus Aminicenantales bacterium]